jgi:hypothetical protein
MALSSDLVRPVTRLLPLGVVKGVARDARLNIRSDFWTQSRLTTSRQPQRGKTAGVDSPVIARERRESETSGGECTVISV